MVSLNEHQRGETFFLNLRFLLIITVFVGNMIEPLISRMDGMYSLYQWIFTFHMPLFVFVTGFFAKSNLFREAGRKILLQIGLQYVIFQSIYSLLDVTVFQVKNIHHSFFAPYLLLWFLASHICWRLLLIALYKLSPLQQIILSVLLGVLAGYVQLDGVWFSFSRTFVFLPFFVAGYHFSFEAFQTIWSRYRTLRSAALVCSIGLFLYIAFGDNYIASGWLYGSLTYMELGEQTWYSGIYRLGLYLLQTFAGLSFLAFVPLKLGKMTELGRRTLYVFLLHGFVVRFAQVSSIYDYVANVATALILIGLTVLATLLLSHPKVRQMTSAVIEPSVHWLLALERRALGQIGAAGKH